MGFSDEKVKSIFKPVEFDGFRKEARKCCAEMPDNNENSQKP
jgi:hypothetical protein